jgi:hypothetical protein
VVVAVAAVVVAAVAVAVVKQGTDSAGQKHGGGQRPCLSCISFVCVFYLTLPFSPCSPIL